MNLIIDVGNTSVKMAVFQKDDILEKVVVAMEELLGKLEYFFSEYAELQNCIVSSVTSIPVEDFNPWRKKIQFTFLDASTPLPFKNKYATPETLGNDRKALVAAASKFYRHKNCLVIDAGSCLTFDFKNNKNEYLGGLISPGLRMRFRALNLFTAKLPELKPQEDTPLIGNSTMNSMNSGVILGMVKEIEGIIKEYEYHYNDLTVIFTGGDAQSLSIKLKNGIFANSNFLLEGLNYILEFKYIQ